MTTPPLAAIAPSKMITRRENYRLALDIVVFTFD